ncbi:hypothetical protein J1614_010564 [Plenodomus biglobosus]|nr:hypothetical protein J1614_010564 [Plenodomus biglobosus]
MRSAFKIAARRAGRIVLALRWTAGKEGTGERLRGSDAARQTRAPEPRSRGETGAGVALDG